MKLKFIATSAALGCALLATGQAQTIINITGATAFRAAAVTSIQQSYNSGYVAGWNTGSSFSGATYQIFSGTFPGISGQTIIRCSWNGSVEGVRALADTTGSSAFDASYLVTGHISSLTGTQQAIGTGTFQIADANLAFSDVTTASTPVSASFTGGGPVGVVVFSMVGGRQWRDDSITTTGTPVSITAQQFRALAASPRPLSIITGGTGGNNDKLVYLIGRNDGSGTRTVYLAETGYGITTPVDQYVNHNLAVSATTNTLAQLVKVASNGGYQVNTSGSMVATPAFASTVWGITAAGNGGYDSGGKIATDLQRTSTATAINFYFDESDATGGYFEATAADKIYPVSWLGYSDARTARASGTGAAILGYNGAILSDLAASGPSLISANDRALIANGKYTAWGFEQLFYNGAGAPATVYNALKTKLNNASVIDTAGMALSEMHVTRSVDGGTVVPGTP